MSVINGKHVSINSDLTAECRNPQQFRYVLVLPFPLYLPTRFRLLPTFLTAFFTADADLRVFFAV